MTPDLPELPKTVGTRFDICQDIALVLKIGRDYQNKDGYRGAHYDTVKLLCDAIEYQQEQLKTKTEVGDAAKFRKALVAIKALTESHAHEHTELGTVYRTAKAFLKGGNNED